MSINSAVQLPCILWLKIKKPRRFSASWFANWVGTLNSEERSQPGEFRLISSFFFQGCIVIGVLLMCASTIGGLKSIIQDASTFQFYS
jgi:hypothetical protein